MTTTRARGSKETVKKGTVAKVSPPVERTGGEKTRKVANVKSKSSVARKQDDGGDVKISSSTGKRKGGPIADERNDKTVVDSFAAAVAEASNESIVCEDGSVIMSVDGNGLDKEEVGAVEEETGDGEYDGVSDTGEDKGVEVDEEHLGDELEHERGEEEQVERSSGGIGDVCGASKGDGAKKALVKYELPSFTLKVLKEVIRKKTFADMKFVDHLDIRPEAMRIGVEDLKFKKSKIHSFLPCLTKKMKTETSILRCSVLRSIKSKFDAVLCREGTSEDMKTLLRSEVSNVGGVIFVLPFEHSLNGYKEVWKWIVMEILPLISFDWKVRVNNGPDARESGGQLLHVVTASDLAFAYTSLEWGARKWATTKNSVSSGGTAAEKCLQEKSISRRGRKSGEEGFASRDNMQRFNKHGNALDRLLYSEGGGGNVASWVDAAMRWVNRDIGCEDDAEDFLLEVVNERRVVPFVSRRRMVVTGGATSGAFAVPV